MPQTGFRGELEEPRLERLREVMDERIAAGLTGGASSMVFQHGAKVFEHFTGDIKEESLVRIASLTKLVTSVTVMTLVDEGRLYLDHDLTVKWLPEFRNVKVLTKDLKEEPAKRGITMRMLLTHTAGFSYQCFELEDHDEIAHVTKEVSSRMDAEGAWDGVPMNKDQTPKKFMEALARVPLAYQPGERYLYSLGFDVAGLVVGRICGKTLGEVMRERIFEPLGMENTGFFVPPEKRHLLGPVYMRTDPHGPVTKMGRESSTLSCFNEGLMQSGGGGLISTLQDYSRFALAVLAAIRGDALSGGRPPLLSRSTAALIAGHAVPEGLPATDLPPGLGQTMACQIIRDPALIGEPQPKGSIYNRGIMGCKCILNAEFNIAAVLCVQRFWSQKEKEQGDLRHIFPALVYRALL